MSRRKRIPSIEDILAPNGRLAKALPNYQHRTEQIEACHAIEQALADGRVCLVEAGTGVGKTLAYLIPAIRAAAQGKRTVVSTHTLNLQTQLVEKDIPLITSLFPEVEITPILMKGRGNYLCLQDQDVAEADLFHAYDPLFRRSGRPAVHLPSLA
jgi:Rad3-related DNA helicase